MKEPCLQAKFVGRKFYFVLDLHYFCIRENMSGIDAGLFA